MGASESRRKPALKAQVRQIKVLEAAEWPPIEVSIKVRMLY